MNPHEFKTDFDKRLLVFLHSKIKQAQQLTDEKAVQQWLDYFSVLLLSGGKRLRPFVMSTMYQGAGGKPGPDMWKGGVALELFHLFALVHDDIMDRSTLRHGVATAHSYISEAMQENPDASHIGVSQAIILGDLLQNWAAEEMPSQGQPLFHAMASQVMVGQMLDINLMHNFQATTKEILEKYELKTANYTFVYPMQIGVALAKGSAAQKTFCEEFGKSLGIAFQIQDDLIDIQRSSHTARKAVLRDMQCGQPTLFSAYVRDHGTSLQAKKLESLFGKPLNTEDHYVLSDIFDASGAVRYGVALIEHYCTKAQKIVQTAPLSPDDKETWFALIDFIRDRQH